MLNITIENWKEYKDVLGISTIPELAEALGVSLRTLESWCYGQRTPAEYATNLITEKLNKIALDYNIKRAKETAHQIVKQNITGTRLLKTKMVRALQNNPNYLQCADAIIQLAVLTDRHFDFFDVLLMDGLMDKDETGNYSYNSNHYYYPVLFSFIMALNHIN